MGFLVPIFVCILIHTGSLRFCFFNCSLRFYFSKKKIKYHLYELRKIWFLQVYVAEKIQACLGSVLEIKKLGSARLAGQKARLGSPKSRLGYITLLFTNLTLVRSKIIYSPDSVMNFFQWRRKSFACCILNALSEFVILL